MSEEFTPSLELFDEYERTKITNRLPDEVREEQEIQDPTLPLEFGDMQLEYPPPQKGGIASNLIYGANEALLAIPQTIISSLFGLDKQVLLRLFNSGDYETQQSILGGLMSYGEGDRLGAQTATERIARGAGQVGGMGLQAAGATGYALKQAATGGASLLQRAINRALGRETKLDTVLSEVPTTLARGYSVPITVGGTTTQADKALGDLKTKIVKGGEEMVASAARNPKAIIAGEVAIGGASGALEETGGIVERGTFGTDTGIGRTIGAFSPVPVLAAGAYLPLLKPVINYLNIPKKVKEGVEGFKTARSDEFDAAEAADQAVATGKKPDLIEKTLEKPEAQKALDDFNRINRRIVEEGEKPLVLNVAEQTRDKRLVAEQKSLTQRVSGEVQDQEVNRLEDTLRDLGGFFGNIFRVDAETQVPNYIVDQATKKKQATIKLVDSAEARAKGAVLALTDEGRGSYKKMGKQDASELGNNIREAVKRQLFEVNKEIDAYATRLKINKNDQFASRGALAEAQGKVQDSLPRVVGEDTSSPSLAEKRIHPMIKEFINFGKKGTDTEMTNPNLTFQDWKMFRNQVTGAMETANSTDKMMLVTLKNELDDMGKAFGKTNENWEKFKSFYDAKRGETFGNRYIAKVMRPAQGSTEKVPRYITEDEDVAGIFMKKSGGVQQYMDMFADDPIKIEGLRTAIVDDLLTTRNILDDTGALKKTTLDAYLNDMKEVMSRVPSTKPDEYDDLYDEFADVGNLVTRMSERLALIKKRRDTILQNGIYQAVVRKENTGEIMPFFAKVMSEPRTMREMTKRVERMARSGEGMFKGHSEEEVMRAFRSVLLDRGLFKETVKGDGRAKSFSQIGQPGGLRPAEMKVYLAENHKLLEAGPFSKQHLDDLYLIADMVERVFLAGGPEKLITAKGGEKTGMLEKISNLTGTSTAGITTRFREVETGRASLFTTGIHLLARAVRAQGALKAEYLMQEALLDSKVAKTLMGKIDKTRPTQNPLGSFDIDKRALKELNTYLFNAGFTGLTEPAAERYSSRGEPKSVIVPGTTRNDEVIESTVPDPAVVPAGKVEIPAVKITAPPIENDSILDKDRSPRNDPAFQKNIQQSQPPPGTPVSAMDLFPFDPTLAAIERRRSPNKTGIMSLT